jgi:hypothetical protein
MVSMVFFIGAILNDVLVVKHVISKGRILIGSEIEGCGIIDGTKIDCQLDGRDGGPGIYLVYPTQTVANATFNTKDNSDATS